MREEWKAVPGYGGFYEVSSGGRVRSLPRTVRRRSGQGYFQAGRVLKQNKIPNGYFQVKLCAVEVQAVAYVHKLVASAFCCGEAPKLVANHINGRKDDNRSANLEWVTRSEDGKHAWRIGLQTHDRDLAKGEDHPNSKLTRKNVIDIRASSKSARELARTYPVCRQTIDEVRRRNSWKHVENDPAIRHRHAMRKPVMALDLRLKHSDVSLLCVLVETTIDTCSEPQDLAAYERISNQLRPAYQKAQAQLQKRDTP